MELEDRVQLATAEGIDVDLVVAGLGSRFLGLFIDSLIQFGLLLLIGLVGNLGNLGLAFVAVGAFLVGFAYPICWETFADGRSPGKRVAGLRVVTTDGRPVTFFTSVIRNAVRIVDFLPTSYLVGMVSILVTERHQRVGDLAAGTMVVVVARPAPPAPAPAGGYAAWLPPGAAAWDLSAVTADDVGLARSFLDRRHELSPDARAQVGLELASRLRPKTMGVPVDQGPERFLELLVMAKLSR